MKILLYSLSVLLLFSCSEDPHEVEDQLYDCLLTHANKENINLDKEVSKLEKQYVKYGLLPNASGKAKVNFYKKIIKTGEFPNFPQSYAPDTSLFKTLNWFNDPECAGKIQDHEVSKSKYFQLRAKMDSLMSTGYATAIQGVKIMLEVLNAEDLEHPYFRAYFILTLNAILEKDTAYMRYIPKKLGNVPPPPDFDSSEVTTIKMDENNVLTLNTEHTELDDLELRLIPIIKGYKEDDRQHIRIEVSDKTEYRLFVKIHATIEAAYNEVLQFYSYREAGLEYDKLSENQKNELKKKHPNRVIEVRPD